MNSEFYEKEVPVLSREDAIAILNTPDEELDVLIDRAKSLRYRYKGNRVSIHILTNARSGNCSQDCAYCAQSCRSTADIDKYKWVDEDKLYQDNDFVNEYHLSRHCIGLSGMKFTDKEIEELARRIRKMKEHGTHLCCSIGFLTEKQARMLKEAGLDRINHNLNSSRSYYHNICSTHTFEQRVQNIRMLQGIGFEICSGGIIGMGESKEDVVDMLLELREIQPEALPINFLLPIKGTPLGDVYKRQEGVTCNYTEPYGSEKVTYDGSDDHTDKLDPWFAAVVDEQSGNDCHYDKSDDISTCRPCQFRRTTSETGEYREPNKTDQKIDQITDGSFFPSEKIQGQINRQIGE